MKLAKFQAELDRECQETWNTRLDTKNGKCLSEQEFAEGSDNLTLEDFKQEVRLHVEVGIDMGLIDEHIEP